MQIPLANIHWSFLLVRDDWGFQVNPLCHHDITRSDRQIGNQHLQLNLTKTELLVVSVNPALHHNFSIQLGLSTITHPNLGVVIDDQLRIS